MSPRKQPEKQDPPVQRVRIRYTKEGPLRFTSHRDFARALERALRRANVPIAYSSGFHPHPRVSYLSAAPTGVASRAEYAELALREVVDPAILAVALDRVLPPGLDVREGVTAQTGGFADRLEASSWRIELDDVSTGELAAAVEKFLASDEVLVTRLTKKGNREFDARHAVVTAAATPVAGVDEAGYAILDLVVRQVTPAVRPDDVLSGLSLVADLEPPVPPRVTRLAQGPLTETGDIADPLEADRESAVAAREPEASAQVAESTGASALRVTSSGSPPLVVATEATSSDQHRLLAGLVIGVFLTRRLETSAMPTQASPLTAAPVWQRMP